MRIEWPTWAIVLATLGIIGVGAWIIAYPDDQALSQARAETAPYLNLDHFTVIALADSVYVCKRNGHIPGSVDCVPIPSGAFLLVPSPVERPQGRAY